MPAKADKLGLCRAVVKTFGLMTTSTITRSDLQKVVSQEKINWPFWLTTNPDNRYTRGVYLLPKAEILQAINEASTEPQEVKNMNSATHTAELKNFAPATSPGLSGGHTAIPVHTNTVISMVHTIESQDLVPKVDPDYVPWGHFDDITTILQSKKFYPTYVTGLSGNGKTLMALQAAAQINREIIRVNITHGTDETNLLGGFRLVNGQTAWHDGPVVVAMNRGAVLLLDEVDLGTVKMMCLQPVLEGSPVFLDKISTLVEPKPGFTIIATANTKGKGSDDGRFVGTNVLNEAFLDRFSATYDQTYPDSTIEEMILRKVFARDGITDDQFVECLVAWANLSRRTNADGGIDEVISTRRLVSICNAYAMFRDKRKAIQICLNRFDNRTRTSFIDTYEKIDVNITKKYEEKKIPTKKVAAPTKNAAAPADIVRRSQWAVPDPNEVSIPLMYRNHW